MNIHGWFRLHGRETSPGRTIITTVNRSGVKLRPAQASPPIGTGLVVFDSVDAALFEGLRQDSRHGFDQVLAVATRRELLANGATWRLLEAGAADVFAWDAMPDPSATIAARFARYASIEELLESPTVSEALAGMSPTWLSLLRQVVEVAAFSTASILITGDSGTGKELVARLIHALDRRAAKGPFVVLDCTTVSPELAGSEFFGHERGSFTTAVSSRDGAFALADRGTLFLDEVGELPLTLQAELLRVTQERVYKRVGSNTWKQANFRLICATNRDLLNEEARGAFRRDFYYRIASWSCVLPSLAQRREDILPLARHFLRKLCNDARPPEPDGTIREYLLTRDYPGNVRELQQLVTRMMSRHVGDGPLTVGDLPLSERLTVSPNPQGLWQDGAFQTAIRRALAMGLGLKTINNQTADLAIQTALADENGNVHRAARKLGVTDRALQMRRALHRQNAGRFTDPAGPSTSTDPSTGG